MSRTAPPRLILRPLAELTEVPESLSGRTGSNRYSGRCQLHATTDLEALRVFLEKHAGSPGTHRLYEREIERLVLWAHHARGLALSSLAAEDFVAYEAFLRKPQPEGLWCGPRAHRDSEDWRPFVGPLGDEAVKTALAAVNSALTWLQEAGYLAGNPLKLAQRERKPQLQGNRRNLDEVCWQAVVDAIEAMPQDSHRERAAYERLRFLSAFMYSLAPRAGEMHSHVMGSFFEDRHHWWWNVLGKGQKEANLPVTDDMFAALVRYRTFLHLSPVPAFKENVPLLLPLHSMLEAEQAFNGTWRPKRMRKATDAAPSNEEAESTEPPAGGAPATTTKKPSRAPSAYEVLARAPAITARQLNRILKDLFEAAVKHLPEDYAYKAAFLRAASAHWVRHTSITAKVDAGIDPRYVQKDARHSDFRTTQNYIHELDEAWHAESQKLSLPAGRPRKPG